MNTPIIRVFLVVLGLFGVLVAATSRWTVFERTSVRANPLNARDRLAQLRSKRGTISAADASPLARSRPRAGGLWARVYPRNGLFSQTVGYDFLTAGTAGLERFYNGVLQAHQRGFEGALRRLQGERPQGDTLRTSLDPVAQRVAIRALGGRAGSVVALDPRTGRIRVMASSPGFNPNAARTTSGWQRLSGEPDAPLLNRATAGLYPPGSTFKVVTAIAAIDTGRFQPISELDGSNGIPISGLPLNNAGSEDFGRISLTFALTKSVNTVWAQVGEQLGANTMERYMRRLGFMQPVQVDLPRDERRASGVYCDAGRRLVQVSSRCVDVGRMAIGQAQLLVTPLQMALVASAVANRGTLMKPFIATRAFDAAGRTTLSNTPQPMSKVMTPSSAAKITAMMTKVVQEGTGTQAALQGIAVAGKTGTAEIDVQRNITQPWFIAFAPATSPRVAIAVTLERVVGGVGGTDAAPIARDVIQALLR